MNTEKELSGTTVGQKAPNFEAKALIKGDIKQISFANYANKWKVLYFYPMDFTFVCPTEITSFSDYKNKFDELGVEVIGISTDSVYSHLAWSQIPRNKGGLGSISHPLIGDFNKHITKQYGVLLENEGVAFRGLFIIDNNNIIQHVSINNLGVGRNVEEVLRLIEAFQHVAKYGEVCPANWQKGNPSMKPDPQGSSEYFKNL